jgi:hypothetical protein
LTPRAPLPRHDHGFNAAADGLIFAPPARRDFKGLPDMSMNVNRYSSMAEALNALRERGYTRNLEPTDDSIQDVDSGVRLTPEDLVIVEHHRFEGASDPDDMSVVYAIEGPRGVRGVIVDAYGAYADPSVAGLLKRIPIRERR